MAAMVVIPMIMATTVSMVISQMVMEVNTNITSSKVSNAVTKMAITNLPVTVPVQEIRTVFLEVF